MNDVYHVNKDGKSSRHGRKGGQMQYKTRGNEYSTVGNNARGRGDTSETKGEACATKRSQVIKNIEDAHVVIQIQADCCSAC
jgi:hypothetical protein